MNASLILIKIEVLISELRIADIYGIKILCPPTRSLRPRRESTDSEPGTAEIYGYI